jgi:hypothetical protein
VDKFTLEITLGNDAMQTPADVRNALMKIANRLERGQDPYSPFEGEDSGKIMDGNGNSVGKWEVR